MRDNNKKIRQTGVQEIGFGLLFGLWSLLSSAEPLKVGDPKSSSSTHNRGEKEFQQSSVVVGRSEKGEKVKTIFDYD